MNSKQHYIEVLHDRDKNKGFLNKIYLQLNSYFFKLQNIKKFKI